MKIEMNPRHVAEIEGAVETVDFKLSNTAHVYQMLSSNVYSDPVRAVIREICCNAIDAHTDAGIPDTPIKVHLPTEIEPWLSVRDFGHGMDRATLMNVYPTYGTSTKGDNEDAIGGLGIGCKSPFAVADTFTVKSIAKGEKYICTGYLGEDFIPKFTLLYEGKTNEPSGVEVIVAIRPSMIKSFKEKAALVFPWFGTVPECNVAVETATIGVSYQINNVKFARVGQSNMHTCVVMGGVSYPINLSNMDQETIGRHKNLRHGVEDIIRVLAKGNIIIEATMGAIDFAISREELRYSKKTVNYIVEVVQKVLDDAPRFIREDFEGAIISDSGPMNVSIAHQKVALKYYTAFYHIMAAFGKEIAEKYQLLAKQRGGSSPYALRSGEGVNLRHIVQQYKIRDVPDNEVVVGTNFADKTVLVLSEPEDMPLTKSILEHNTVRDKSYLVLSRSPMTQNKDAIADYIAKHGLQSLPVMRREDFVKPPRAVRSSKGSSKRKPDSFMEVVVNQYDYERRWAVCSNAIPEEDDVAYMQISGYNVVGRENLDAKEFSRLWGLSPLTKGVKLVFVRKTGLDSIPEAWTKAEDLLAELVGGLTNEDRWSLWTVDFSLSGVELVSTLNKWHPDVEKPKLAEHLHALCRHSHVPSSLMAIAGMIDEGVTNRERAVVAEEVNDLFKKMTALRYATLQGIGHYYYIGGAEADERLKNFYEFWASEFRKIEKEVDNE